MMTDTAAPLFSIITITRNNLRGLKKTAESVRSQNHADYEWIVIDGASTDGTVSFLAGQDIPHTSEPDRGIYDAMNKGIEKARGAYLIFMNAGDQFARNDVLMRIAQTAVKSSPDLIYGDAHEGNESRYFYKRAKPVSSIDSGLFTHHQAIFYRAKTLSDLRYNLTYSVAADYDLTRRFLRRAKSVRYLPFAVCLFEPGGLSQCRASAGRREQFIIRSRDGVSVIKNAGIYLRQSIAWAIRRAYPPLYEAWKARALHPDNNDTGGAPDITPPGRP
jgi:putative colanic acid biosynthesis glycosyltransferase